MSELEPNEGVSEFIRRRMIARQLTDEANTALLNNKAFLAASPKGYLGINQDENRLFPTVTFTQNSNTFTVTRLDTKTHHKLAIEVVPSKADTIRRMVLESPRSISGNISPGQYHFVEKGPDKRDIATQSNDNVAQEKIRGMISEIKKREQPPRFMRVFPTPLRQISSSGS